MKFHLNSTSLFTIAAGVAVTVLAASPAKADTFSINGKAMDTGFHQPRINGGGPRMILWDHFTNNANQNFDLMQGNRGGRLLKHRSTGWCLNAYQPRAGSSVNTYPCNPNDPEQNFQLLDQGNSYQMIKLVNTNLCVDSTPSTNNNQQVILWNCLPAFQNHYQRWLMTRTGGGSTNPSPSPSPIVSRAEKANQFFTWANGQWSIQRRDRDELRRQTGSYLDGECVSLVARYFQDVFLNGSSQYRAYYHGKDTAWYLATYQSQYFSPYTRQGLPSRGAVISFPGATEVGHVGIVLNSRYTVVNNVNVRQVEILESNANGKAPSTSVTSRWVNIDGWNPYGGTNGWTNPKW
jgi:Ricin-type beta-trefoil lectin domain/CHAP domain